jgi:ABC-type amino acid transport substrate-binding protein
MKRVSRGMLLLILLIVLIGISGSAKAETTLEKIARTGALTIGTRTGSPPFGYVNKNNDWVGFSIELVESAIAPVLSKKIGKQIKVEKKESTPQTRIPLLTSNAVDLIAETMTDTQSRRESVDFSITYFVTGAQFLVKKGNAINGLRPLRAKGLPRNKARPTRASFGNAFPQPSWWSFRINRRLFKRWRRAKCKPTPMMVSNSRD